MSKSAVDEELRVMMATVGRGRESLRQMGLGYPGGDSCPTMVIRGLAKIRKFLHADVATVTDREERAALQWLDHWLEAGQAMLPKGGEDV